MAAPPAPAQRPPLPMPPSTGTWESLLGWCRTTLGAEAAFVIDELGLLIANAGRIPDEEAQAMGARLVVALEQADELEQTAPVRALAIELTARYLTGFRLRMERGSLLAVGMVSARALPGAAAVLIRRAFASKLAGG